MSSQSQGSLCTAAVDSLDYLSHLWALPLQMFRAALSHPPLQNIPACPIPLGLGLGTRTWSECYRVPHSCPEAFTDFSSCSCIPCALPFALRDSPSSGEEFPYALSVLWLLGSAMPWVQIPGPPNTKHALASVTFQLVT